MCYGAMVWAGISKQILTAQSDGVPGGDRRAGMNSTLGVIISTTIRLQSSQYYFVLYTEIKQNDLI